MAQAEWPVEWSGPVWSGLVPAWSKCGASTPAIFTLSIRGVYTHVRYLRCDGIAGHDGPHHQMLADSCAVAQWGDDGRLIRVSECGVEVEGVA